MTIHTQILMYLLINVNVAYQFEIISQSDSCRLSCISCNIYFNSDAVKFYKI